METRKKTYLELLNDPRWQKKRLEIMQRDDFTCQSCENKELTLNVHHLAYHKNTMLWDYKNEELITLCEDCHKQITAFTNESISLIRSTSWYIDSSEELLELIKVVKGMNPYLLLRVRQFAEKIYDLSREEISKSISQVNIN